MQSEMLQLVSDWEPTLLDWNSVEVKVIKDPAAPLSVVSELGVVHGGLEKDSAVYRLADGACSCIVKRHTDPDLFRREAANIAFVNMAGSFAPMIYRTNPATGIILMEDLGDDSLAHVWKSGRMDDYRNWLRQTVDVVLQVQCYFHQHEGRLQELYGDLNPESRSEAAPAAQAVGELDETLRISRGSGLPEDDRRVLLRTAGEMRRRLQAFNKKHREFVLGLNPLHIIMKEGRIRIIDLTFPPIGSALGQFENMTWHLEDGREFDRCYLRERDRLGLPHIDNEEYLLLSDWRSVLGCICWIRIYCREIIEGERSLADLGGKPLADYEGSERANLEAIYRATAPHRELHEFAGVIRHCFSKEATWVRPSTSTAPNTHQRLRAHDIVLSDGPLRLRPMTEDDWDVLQRWNTDAEVLYYCEGADVSSRAPEETRHIYRSVSQTAFVFMAELDGKPIGECWLQKMNLPRVLNRYPPEKDLRRIDLTIGERRLWGQGCGTKLIGLLVRFGFEECGADAIFGVDVADYNPRSRRAFEKNGFILDRVVAQPPGGKAKEVYDLVLTRAKYQQQPAT